MAVVSGIPLAMGLCIAASEPVQGGSRDISQGKSQGTAAPWQNFFGVRHGLGRDMLHIKSIVHAQAVHA